jgi:hypothetical protein
LFEYFDSLFGSMQSHEKEESSDYSSEEVLSQEEDDDWEMGEIKNQVPKPVIVNASPRYRCVLCEQTLEFSPLLEHLAVAHRLVIGDVDKIAILEE